MTVQELINELNKITDKNLQVVADLGLDFCDRQKPECIRDVFVTEEYFGMTENFAYVAKTRKCVKII